MRILSKTSVYLLFLQTLAFADQSSLGLHKSVGDFVEAYCIRCHNEEKHKGDIRLDLLGKTTSKKV